MLNWLLTLPLTACKACPKAFMVLVILLKIHFIQSFPYSAAAGVVPTACCRALGQGHVEQNQNVG